MNYQKIKVMKQTVEKAAMNFANYESNNLDKLPFKVKNVVDYDNGLTRGFKAGAEWQARQSPWISVKEQLPEYNIEVIIYHEYRFYVGFMYYSMKSNWWRVNGDERTDMIVSEDDFWMPIPSFDEILEANKDVLERIKEKGD